MERPPLSLRYHYNHSYVPHPRPPPPPKNPDNHCPTNFLPHHRPPPQPPPQFHLLPVFHPQPPPQPPPPLPPTQLQPPYDPHRSQFTFLNHHPPIEDDTRRRLLFHFDFNPQSSPPRVRTDHWAEPPPRVLADHHRNKPLPIRLDHRTPPHHRSFAVRGPVSHYSPQGNNHQLDLERSFHFRDDYVGGFTTYRNENFLLGRNKTENLLVNDDDNMLGDCRDDYMLETDRSSRNTALGDSLDNFDPIMPQDFVPNVRNFESFRGYPLDSERFRDSRDEDGGFGHSNQLQREGRSFISGMGNSDYSGDDGNAGVVMRRETDVLGLGRFHGRERKNGTEFIHTPKKKAQKKSALLRIQLGKPNNRNRSHDQHFSKAFFDESKPSPLKGKDKDSFQYLHHGGGEGREGSPVELDVSFKSNALVAKAIVAPSDSAAVESVEDLTPRNRRIRKLTLSDSPLTNSFENSVRLDSSTYGSNCPSSFEKAPKKLSKKVTDTGVCNTGTGACNIGPEPCVNGTNDSPGTSLVKRSPKSLISGQGCTSIEPDGIPLRIKKRKRLRTPLSSTSSLQLREQNGESFNLVGSISGISAASVPAKGGTLTEAKDTSSGEVTAHVPSDEKGDPKIDQFPCTILSLPSSSDTNCIVASVSKTGKAIQVEHNNIDVGVDTIDRSACGTEPILGFGKDLTETTVYDPERVDTSEQSSENEECGVASTQTIDPMGNVGMGIQNPIELTFSEDHVGKRISFDGTCDASSAAHGLMNGIDNIIVSQAKSAEIGSEKPLLSCVVTEEILNVVPVVECNPVLCMPKTDDTRMHGGASTADSSKHDLSTTCNGDPEHTGSPGNISDHILGSNSNVSGENLPMEGRLKPKGLLGNYADVGSGQDYTPKVKRKRKNRKRKRKSNPLGVFGIPRSNDKSGNVAGLVYDADSSLCFPLKNIVSADQKHLVSSSGDSGIGSKPCTAGDSDLHCNNLNEMFSKVELSARDGVGIGPSGTSPNYTKKRKVLSPGFASSMPSEICTDASMPCAEPAHYVDKGTALSEENLVLSEIGTFCSSALPTCANPVELESNLVGISVGLAGDCCTDNCSRNESSWMSKGEAKQKEDVSLGVAVTSNYESCITDMANSIREEKVAAVNGIQEQVMHGTDTLPCRPPLAKQTPDSIQGTPSVSDNFLPVKDHSPSVANDLSPLVNGEGVSASNSGDEFVDSVSDSLSNMGSPVDLCIDSNLQLLSTGSKSGDIFCRDGKELDENSVPLATCSDTTKINATLGNPKVRDLTVSTKNELDLSHDAKLTMALNPTRAASSLRQNPPSSTCFRPLPPKLSSNFSTSGKAVRLNHLTKPLTWHRTAIPSAPSVAGAKSFSNPVLPQRQWHKDVANVASSYIRKGNSLVRKPSPSTDLRRSPHASNSSVYRQNPSVLDEIQKGRGSESRVVGSLNSLGKGVSNASLCVKPLPTHSTVLPRIKNIHVEDIIVEPSQNSFSANALDFLELEDNTDPLKPCNDVPKFSEDASKSCGTPECKTSPSNSLEIQSAPYEGHPLKKIIYVKRKSNQLVAASNSGDLSAQGVDKTQALSSDGYYKKRKNQLIRTSLESQSMERVAVSDDHLNPERQWVSDANPSRSSGKRQHREGLAKTQKLSKCSLVWSRQSTGKDVDPLCCQKVWPHFFPWKRATYWKNYMHNLSSIASVSSFTTISRKLFLSRKRNAIYRRSSHGFSLRISKVLSIGGSNLKWSKSIEKRSTKVNEEATVAVAAAEKRKREQSVTVHTIAGSKCRNQTYRERIFLIGSIRYKMDPTRHTLQRISSDDEGSSLASVQCDKDSKKSYVPRRLLIGNDEYVRIGNGNQLVRNPKRRTRILASEKVRWSLHTARLRLSRKKKYCQFFTRFGKCNKDSGKCPFIHDPSKIVVCTKFLNGSCSDAKCKLTHKVIPERMQDCSYFLQGLCSNENCPYRHVNVNSNASVCQGFLRGYCAEGNECRKKHTYTCSIFEATGACPQGSKCKLHHPKNRKKGMKRKFLREQRNANGRYFGTRHINAVECKTAISEMHSAKEDEDFFCRDGKFTDFISLDTNDEEAKEFSDLEFDESNISGSDVSDAQVPDLEQLIKPVRIMNRNLTIQTLSPIDSPSEKSASSISLDFDCFK